MLLTEMQPCDIATPASDLRWSVVSEVKPPASGTVQIWCSLLQSEAARQAESEPWLAPEELERAGRFRTATLRQRFVASRGILRRILGRCLDLAPGQVRFETDPRGKPRLLAGGDIEFNLAHTHDLMLLAVTRRWPVGVDVERIRRLNDAPGIARRFFTQREADWLQRVSEGRIDRAFFDLWTRKEAILKATGAGLSGGLAALELLAPDGTYKGTVVDESARCKGATWVFTELEPAAGFVGALALPDDARKARLHTATFAPG